MPRGTTFEELYTTIGEIVQASTGRVWWKKTAIQARPSAPYAVVYISNASGIEKPYVEVVELEEELETGERFQEIPWNTALLEVWVEFYKSLSNNTALQAAQRFKSALHLTERYFDLWQIAALSGGVRIIDISAIFREDTESRTEVRFSLQVNLAMAEPLEGNFVHEIEIQEVGIVHVKQDGDETEVNIDIDQQSEESS